MRVAMVRVGIDAGAGGMQGPLFPNGSFEFVPIPDRWGIDARTYGNFEGRHGRPLIEYFSERRQAKMMRQSIHLDPDFTTFTYGDPTPPKAGLRHLRRGDMLIFYCGLEGWDFRSAPGLYLMGYFDVLAAGMASEFSKGELHHLFAANFHVLHKKVFQHQRDKLVLVKGSAKSRLLKRAVLMSVMGHDRTGQPLKVLSPKMQKVFGGFGGKISFQRSPTRWVVPSYTERAVDFMRSLH
ncbi:MAG: hypothetical protein LAO21_22990 [Acidobacteriia bacterium]|nr:hypothetical protein [Terriglobia bacterium]